MTLKIGDEIYENVKKFSTDYQEDNGNTFWVFIVTNDDDEFAVCYEPSEEQIICF